MTGAAEGNRATRLGSADAEVAAGAFEEAVLESLAARPDRLALERWTRAYRRLSAALTGDRDQTLGVAPSGQLGGADETAVSGLVYAARTFLVASRVLRAVPLLPGPLLELGAGWGPFGLAHAALHPGASDRRVALIDLASERLVHAAALFRAAGMPAPETRAADITGDLSKLAVGTTANIAVPFALNELLASQPADTRVAAGAGLVRSWARALPSGGRVVILEPGVHGCARLLQAIRDALIDDGEVAVVAPCTHGAPCPMLPRRHDWCHFTWHLPLGPVARQVAAAARRRADEVHFSWLVVERPRLPARSASFPPPHQIAQRVIDIRAPDKHRLSATLCGAGGLVTLTAHRRQADAYSALAALPPASLVTLDRSGTRSRGDGLRLLDPAVLTVVGECPGTDGRQGPARPPDVIEDDLDQSRGDRP